ncbi:WASH complex subunit 2-like isoform X2 [Ornithodoros turicata]|uniref:WASH complex subunit 2-like isoform X2 n=1 Tax=Ornithodoros turicata TaxID=34597 RepID=UPI00313A237D
MSSACNSEDDQVKPWEKPLTTDEIRLRAAKWTLADDSQLLAYLQCMSEDIISRTCDVGKDLDSLVHETTVSGVKVNNVVNDFNLLSSLQFIENRVYDEEAKEGEGRAMQNDLAPQSKEEQEAALLARVTKACQLGIDVVRSALEPLDLPAEADSDESEDEGGIPAKQRALSPILRSKDPYLDRPLPHLIGSQAFLDDDYVGLGDILAEEDEKSSRGEYESEKSDSDVETEDEDKMASSDNRMAETMQREFGRKEEESEEEEMFEEKVPVPRKTTRISTSSSELQSDEDNFLSSTTATTHVKRGSLSSKKSVDTPSNVERGVEDLFSEPTGHQDSDEESNSPFKTKKGAFYRPGKLFDDEEEEGDLFKTESKPKEEEPAIRTPKHTGYTESGKKIPVGGVSMLGGAGQPLFQAISRLNSNPQNEEDNNVSPAVKTVTRPESKGSAESERKVFEPAKREGKKEPSPVKSVVEDFDDDDLFSVPPTKKAGQPKRAGPTPPSKLFDADDDDDLWLSGPSKTQSSGPQNYGDKTVKPKAPAVADKATVPVSTTGGLFDDDADDLFSSSSVTKKAEPNKKTTSFLFDDEEEEGIFTGGVQPKGTSVPTNKSLFTASTDSDELFSSGAKPPATKAPHKGLFLFEDEEDEPVKAENSNQLQVTKPSLPAAEASPTSVIKPRKSISLFDDDEPDDDLFSGKTKEMADSQSSHSVQSSTWSLGSKENVEPSPAHEESAKPVESLKARTSSRFLFDEEDKLFQNSTGDGPDIDLFASDKVDTGSSTEKKKPVGGVLPFGGADLFGAELRSKLGKSAVLEESCSDPPEVNKNDDLQGSSPPSSLQHKRGPALKDTKEGSVSFDEPVDKASTLASATKDRAKIQTKRRLPSRMRRRSNIPPDSPDSSSTKEESPLPKETISAPLETDSIEAEAKPSSSLAVPQASMVKSPSTEEEDLFAVMENTLKPVPEPVKSLRTRDTARTQVQLAHDDEDDLFSASDKVTIPVVGDGLFSSRPKAAKSSIAENLFSPPNKPIDDIFAEPSAVDSDALFGSGDSPAASAKTETKVHTSLFQDDTTTVKDVLSKPAPQKQDIFEDDYDIFSSPSSKPVLKSSKHTSLFGDNNDDTDDIFASKPTPKSTSQVSQKPSATLKSATSQSVDFKDPLLHGADDD